ncbi:MAG: IS91 family transposase [Sedimenticolaceae bacterium]
MIRLATLIQQFEADFLDHYGDTLLPGQRRALAAMKACRTRASRHLQVACKACQHTDWIPHSCGHRACPHCQHHEAEQWLQRQRQRQLPVRYFLATFTLPRELRDLAWAHQRQVYDAMIRCSWQTLAQFAQNDRQLRGQTGAIAVLHTHSRRLDFHPHIHVVIPAGAVDEKRRLWRTKRSKGKRPYLFSHKALAKVFRAKLLHALTEAGLYLPARYPEHWVVDCKAVGTGEKGLVYLSRYLYRGVLLEKHIVACKDGMVTFRYRDSKTGKYQQRTETGARFLALILRHVLPKGFRRARNFGFLHPNRKRLIALLQVLLPTKPAESPAPTPRPPISCPCCGQPMVIVRTGITPFDLSRLKPTPTPLRGQQAM